MTEKGILRVMDEGEWKRHWEYCKGRASFPNGETCPTCECYREWKCGFCGDVTSIGNGVICSACGCECCCYCTGLQEEAPWSDNPMCPKCEAGPGNLKEATKSNKTLGHRIKRLEAAEAEKKAVSRDDPMRRVFQEEFRAHEIAKIGYKQTEPMCLGFEDKGSNSGIVRLVLQCEGGPTVVLVNATWGQDGATYGTREEARAHCEMIGKRLDQHKLLYEGG